MTDVFKYTKRKDIMLLIKFLESSDNIQEYLDCVNDLNSKNVKLASVEEIKKVLQDRPLNVITFVGLIDDKIVATATMMVEKKLRYGALCCHIEDVAVHKDYRNRGYGTRIVKYCVDIAKRSKCYKIKLNCNKSLMSFYEKLGFESDSFGMVLDNSGESG